MEAEFRSAAKLFLREVLNKHLVIDNKSSLLRGGMKPNPIIFKLLAAVWLALAGVVNAETEIIFSYWHESGPPFVVEKDNVLTGGIVKDIGDRVAKELNLQPKYILIPTKRVEIRLAEGGIHVACMSNPQWFENGDLYDWSEALFGATDNFIVKAGNENSIMEWDDLDGKRIGVYVNYVYHPNVMKKFAEKKTVPVKVSGFEAALNLLSHNRLDAVIDFGIIARSYLKENNLQDEFKFAQKAADEFELYCAISKKSPHDAEGIRSAIKKIVDRGDIDKVLENYSSL